MSQTLVPSAKPCLYYSRGACKEGAACRFSHADGRTFQRMSASPPTQNRTTAPGVCSFWQQRRCTKGDTCAYSHSDDNPGQTSWRTRSTSVTASVPEAPLVPTPKSAGWTADWSPKLPCKFWREGRCFKGDACTFEHQTIATDAVHETFPVRSLSSSVVLNPEASELISTFSALTLSNQTEKGQGGADIAQTPHKPCTFWKEGKCFKGDSCAYGHSGPGATNGPSTRPVAVILPPAPQGPIALSPCRFWLQGHCRFGSACLLDHPLGLDSSETAPRMMLEQSSIVHVDAVTGVANPEPAVERNYGSARTTFGPGGRVITIITSLESSRLIITGLPETFTLERLQSMLQPFSGVIHAKLNEIIRKDGRTRSLSASVEFAHPNQASDAYAALDEAAVGPSTLACRLEKPYQTGSGSLRTTTVQLSWRAPACMAFAHYDTREEASRHVQRLDGRYFRGSQVSATLMNQQGVLPTFRRRRALSYHEHSAQSNYTVLIKGLPVDAGDEDVEQWTSSDSVDLRLTYNEEDGMRAVEALMEEIGPVISFRHLARTAQRQKCLVTFRDADAVVTAVAKYNSTQQGAIGKGILYAKALWSIRWYVLPRHFTVIGAELKEIREQLREVQGGTHLYIESGDTRTTLTLSGDDPKDFGAVKRTIQGLIDGDAVVDEKGSLVWDPFFDTPAGTSFIHYLSDQTKSFVFRNSKRQMLTLSGTSAVKAVAREQILAQVGKQRFIGPLDPQTWRQLVSGDLKELEAEIGEETATLDATKRLLVIRGSEEAFRTAKTFVQNATAAIRAGLPTTMTACPVCFCDPSNVVQLRCGHGYCNACLKDYLLSASSTKTFPVLCVAAVAQGTCASPISLATIQQILTTEQERTFFRSAFSAYVQQNPKEVRYCPSADCEWVYRPQPAGSSILLCESCLQRVCAACHVTAHEGLTCEEYREAGTPDGLATKLYKKANNIKACPGCGIDIWKDEGCNHITCGGCRTHICWVCMATFPRSGEVYDHMSRVHGGIYD